MAAEGRYKQPGRTPKRSERTADLRYRLAAMQCSPSCQMYLLRAHHSAKGPEADSTPPAPSGATNEQPLRGRPVFAGARSYPRSMIDLSFDRNLSTDFVWI